MGTDKIMENIDKGIEGGKRRALAKSELNDGLCFLLVDEKPDLIVGERLEAVFMTKDNGYKLGYWDKKSFGGPAFVSAAIYSGNGEGLGSMSLTLLDHLGVVSWLPLKT